MRSRASRACRSCFFLSSLQVKAWVAPSGQPTYAGQRRVAILDIQDFASRPTTAETHQCRWFRCVVIARVARGFAPEPGCRSADDVLLGPDRVERLCAGQPHGLQPIFQLGGCEWPETGGGVRSFTTPGPICGFWLPLKDDKLTPAGEARPNASNLYTRAKGRDPKMKNALVRYGGLALRHLAQQ